MNDKKLNNAIIALFIWALAIFSGIYFLFSGQLFEGILAIVVGGFIAYIGYSVNQKKDKIGLLI